LAIHLLSGPAKADEVADMLSALGDYIKVAVDIERGILAGGGVMHADCERGLLDDGSRQGDLWGGDWLPQERKVRYSSMINIRPAQNSRSTEVQNASIRSTMERIIVSTLGGG